MWRIYYGDGSTVDDSTPVADVPGVDVQLIVQADPNVGWAMLHGRDFYIWFEGDYWQGVEQFGLFDYLARPGVKKVIFGRWLTRDEFQALYVRAKADRDFARKSGFLRSEQPDELTEK